MQQPIDLIFTLKMCRLQFMVYICMCVYVGAKHIQYYGYYELFLLFHCENI